MPDDIKIFVYGSCRLSAQPDSNEVIGNGGYGVVINVNGNKVEEISGGYTSTTNARMDIIGITEGLKRIERPGNVSVYLTNGYVIDTLTKGWLQKWKKSGFKKKKHLDLWIELDRVLSAKTQSISFKHSKEVRFHPDFKHAEQLGKTMSGKKNLPADLSQPSGSDLFGGNNYETSTEVLEITDDEPVIDSICVDASSVKNPGPTEYRGVDTASGKIIFERKYEEATNNIGEFLAIVHALALYKKQEQHLKVVYSDSLNAISWVKQKKCKTKLERTENNAKVFNDIQRAVAWLESNDYETKVLKWNTRAWGAIPADYGRK